MGVVTNIGIIEDFFSRCVEEKGEIYNDGTNAFEDVIDKYGYRYTVRFIRLSKIYHKGRRRWILRADTHLRYTP